MPPPPVPPMPSLYMLDANLDDMEGIVDPRAIASQHTLNPQASFSSIASSTGTYIDDTRARGHRTRYSSSSNHSIHRIGANGIFSDPFATARANGSVNGHSPASHWDSGRVSPRSTRTELPRVGSPWPGSEHSHGPTALNGVGAGPGGVNPLAATSPWEVPQSWHTMPASEDALNDPGGAGSEDEGGSVPTTSTKKDRRPQ